MRAAAGTDGLHETFRRALGRLQWRAQPARGGRAARGARRRAAADRGGRAAAAKRFEGIELRPAPVADAVIGWAASESAGYRAGSGPAVAALRVRVRDRLLVAVTLLPALALVGT